MPDQQQQPQQGEIAGLVFDKFAGVNTATTRPGVPDEMAYWLDGFMPLAPGNLRTLYGVGAAKYTATGGKSIACFYFYNLGAVPYAIVFLSDGSAIQVNTSTGAATTVLPAATIAVPNVVSLGITQYGSQYLIIVSNQLNGYWVWDGAILYKSGSLAPQVTLTNVGSSYSTPPVVTATGGNGSGATFVATIANGVVIAVVMTNPGTGYLPGDVVTLVFTGGTAAGSGAVMTATLSRVAGGSGATFTAVMIPQSGAFTISSVTVNNGGTGYSALTTMTTSGGGAGSTPATLTPVIVGGVITSVTVIAGGKFTGTPTVTASDSGYYDVTSVSISNGGSGYSPSTTIAVSGGGGPQTQAVIVPTITGGVITGTNITNKGVYASNTPPTLAVNDTSVTAAGTVTLMPFGIQGTCAETYQGHVWVFNGTLYNFTAPGSVANFATSAGGGSDQTNNSYTKVGYYQAVSTNGFLFLIGDSSMDYISGVVTTTPQGGSPTTTFTQNNSDPEVGTPYPAAVTTLGQEILVANSAGIFVSSGGTFVKKSEALDGVYNSVPNFAGGQLSAAKATIFGKRVWMVLATIIDPVSNIEELKILMFNGQRWWASTQDVSLSFIGGQEINSVYTAWGTDGTHLYPLFQQPSVNVAKVAQSKLWDIPGGIESTKASSRFWSDWQCYNTTATQINVYIDGVGIDQDGAQFTNQELCTIAGPTSTGYFITPAQAIGQQGVLTGMTITTAAADMALISAKVMAGDVGYRG
jgi:hypothetical protein